MVSDRRAYKKAYWQDFKKRKKRVYGTLSLKQYRAIKAIADQEDRALWQQIWLESCAYRRQEFLPGNEILSELRELKVQIRRIGNNINQISRQSNTFKKLMQKEQLLKQLQILESKIEISILKINPKS